LLRRRIDRGEKLDADNEKLKPLLREVCVRARGEARARALPAPRRLFYYIRRVRPPPPRPPRPRSECDQMRLLMLYLLSSKTVEQKFVKELQALAELSAEQRHTLANLSLLKVPASRGAAEPRPPGAPFVDDETMRRNKKVAEKTQKLCRYVPKLEDIVTHHLCGTLPEDKYPWVKAPPRGGARGAGAGAGSDDAGLGSAIAYHGAHGEVVNKYAAQTIEEMRSGAGADARSGGGGASAAGKRGKESRFTMKTAATAVAGGLKTTASFVGAKPGGGGEAAEPPDLYAQYLEPPSLRAYAGGRIVVFVLGGLSQVEAAAMDRLSKTSNRELVVGTTSLLTAQDLVDAVFDADPPMGAAAGGRGAEAPPPPPPPPADEPAAKGKGGKAAKAAPAKKKGKDDFADIDMTGIDLD
jgi:hypothetical protein